MYVCSQIISFQIYIQHQSCSATMPAMHHNWILIFVLLACSSSSMLVAGCNGGDCLVNIEGYVEMDVTSNSNQANDANELNALKGTFQSTYNSLCNQLELNRNVDSVTVNVTIFNNTPGTLGRALSNTIYQRKYRFFAKGKCRGCANNRLFFHDALRRSLETATTLHQQGGIRGAVLANNNQNDRSLRRYAQPPQELLQSIDGEFLPEKQKLPPTDSAFAAAFDNNVHNNRLIKSVDQITGMEFELIDNFRIVERNYLSFDDWKGKDILSVDSFESITP